MPVQGQLSEIDVSSILQVLCVGKRRSSLKLEQQGEEGAILIDQGQVVHATLGGLHGKEAFFRLVMWREGTFQISELAEVPTRTITESWDYLLLEGTRRCVGRHLERRLLPTSLQNTSSQG